MNIRPLGDRVLVEPIEEKEQTVGGIYIPDSAKEKPMQGKVLAVGKKLDKDGKEIKFDVKKRQEASARQGRGSPRSPREVMERTGKTSLPRTPTKGIGD